MESTPAPGSPGPGSPRTNQLIFEEVAQDDDFKKKVCIPYFRDIFKVVLVVFTISGLERKI